MKWIPTYDNCWYIEQTKSGRYLFHRHKNLNAQVNSYVKGCTYVDRDAQIEGKLTEMFEPKDKRCYQKLAVLPALDEVQLERDKTTLVVLKPDTDFAKFFAGEKFKNRMEILTADDQTGIFNVNKKAERLWAITQVVKDLSVEDAQYKKAKETLAEYQTELFIALKAVFRSRVNRCSRNGLKHSTRCCPGAISRGSTDQLRGQFSKSGQYCARRSASDATIALLFMTFAERPMRLIRLFNACHHFPGFVYEHARLLRDVNTIEVEVRPCEIPCRPLAPGVS